MASFETFQKLAENPDWIAPRSDLRVFLGEPTAPEATKTTVEPGNAFSPGMMTYGVTWWIRLPDTNQFFAPEEASLETLNWRYEEGFLPAITCSTVFNKLDIQHTIFQDGTQAHRDEAVAAQLRINNPDDEAKRIQVFIILRSLGPAGGPISHLAIDENSIMSHDICLMRLDSSPTMSGCGIGDPSEFARDGTVPENSSVEDTAGWCYALLRYDVTLKTDDQWLLTMDCPLRSQGSLHEELPGTATPQPENFAPRLERHLALWRKRFNRISLSVPDKRFQEAYFAGLGHMLTAMVGDQARIAALSYPLPWLRDSIFIIRCLDLAGHHDLARRASEYCARNDFFGGFGAEGDAPGQGIWALVQHYRVTDDLDWLAQVYPAIKRKVEWLYKMRRAEAPIQITVDTPVLAFSHAARNSGVICLAAKHGIIMGNMDHGIAHSIGWINQWAICGLTQAIIAADALTLTEDVQSFRTERDQLREALRQYVSRNPDYFHQARTMNSVLYPTQAWEAHEIISEFDEFWQNERQRDGCFNPEPYWLYFELAQAHNALLLGHREHAWEALDYRLENQDLPGLYGYREGGDGIGTENAVHGVTLINQLRGCHKFDSITPHGWSQAELWLLQRAVLITETETQVRLFAGVPVSWLKAGCLIEFQQFPSIHGRVSASLRVTEQNSFQITVDGIRAGVKILIDLPCQKYEFTSDGARIAIELKQ